MKFGDMLKKAGLAEDAKTDPKPLSTDVAPEKDAAVASTRPGSAAAALLMSRMKPQADSATTPRSAPSASSAASASVDEEVVDLFRNAANESKAPGYVEFFRQAEVLKKHLTSEAALYGAVLDSLEASGVEPGAVLRAVNDRIRLVREEKENSLQHFTDKREHEISANQKRVAEIDSTLQQLRAQITELENGVSTLTAEREQLASESAEVSERYEKLRGSLMDAAELVLRELSAQQKKISSALAQK